MLIDYLDAVQSLSVLFIWCILNPWVHFKHALISNKQKYHASLTAVSTLSQLNNNYRFRVSSCKMLIFTCWSVMLVLNSVAGHHAYWIWQGLATFDCLSKIIKITNYRQNDFKLGANLMFPLYACYYQNNRNINRFNITRVLILLNNEM